MHEKFRSFEAGVSSIKSRYAWCLLLLPGFPIVKNREKVMGKVVQSNKRARSSRAGNRKGETA